MAEAQQQVDVVAADLRKRFATKESAGLHFRLERMYDDLVQDVRPAILVLMGAVTFVLLIACANVANLLLVRSAGRQRELAVRAALGGNQGRLVRQLLTESLVISGGGVLLGLFIAQAGIETLRRIGPATLPRLQTVTIDPIVLSFAAAAGVLSAVIFGIIPAIRDVAARCDGRPARGRPHGGPCDGTLLAERGGRRRGRPVAGAAHRCRLDAEKLRRADADQAGVRSQWRHDVSDEQRRPAEHARAPPDVSAHDPGSAPRPAWRAGGDRRIAAATRRRRTDGRALGNRRGAREPGRVPPGYGSLRAAWLLRGDWRTPHRGTHVH